MPKTPVRKLSKSKFSMYLRTQCDRELYLSLFQNNPAVLSKAGIPIPLKSRPGVQIITKSGHEFEYEQYDTLIRTIPEFIVHKGNGRTDIDPIQALKSAPTPSIILQPEIKPQSFRDEVLGNLGLDKAKQGAIPELSGLRPDVLYVHSPVAGECEITPDGSRKRIAEGDKRSAISVIDLKNVTEANASYSAEVCLYAFFLASWLESQGAGLKDCYFVSDRVYLWKHNEMPRFTELLGRKEGGDHKNLLKALIEDLEDGLVNYLIYMPSVRKFFKEDVPRVVQKGDAEGWHAVEYHVNPRCSSCDWLGNPNWLVGDDKAHYEKNPAHYCFHSAEVTDHLSKMANLSKGASYVLTSFGHQKIQSLVGLPANADVLKKHALLKKDRAQISHRAVALSTDACSVDTSSRVAGLARSLNAEYDIIVNFDAGSGFLTGVALRGMLFAPYGHSLGTKEDGSPETFRVLGEKDFVIPKDNLVAEWSALQSFIETFAKWIASAEGIFQANGLGGVKTQICFWEPRQYEELCNAFGRHLLKILDLDKRHERALAWIFPAEQLMELDDQCAPGLVFIRDIVNTSVHSPLRFANTLLGMVRHYHHANMTPRSVDKYYVEPLSNAIPRERIFEIWKSPTGTVRMFGKDVGIADAIQKYGDVLKAHTWALASIARRLRDDLKGCIEGKAPTLKTPIPQGLQGVAHDSKLWAQWEVVSAHAAETEGRLNLITRTDWLESAYKAIVLESVTASLGNNRYEFIVSEESTEAKIEEGDGFCAVGISSLPGFPLQTGKSLDLSVGPADTKKLWAPLHRVLAAKLETFDRANRRAIVSFHARSSYFEPVFDAIIDADVIPVGKQPIYILPGLPYDDSEVTLAILRNIGNPGCATTAREALTAMGQSAAKKLPKGTDADTPIARVLWKADVLAKTAVRSEAEVDALAAVAKSANAQPLDPSQEKAVRAASKNALSVIWGPPGTGKTDTLVAFLHAVVGEGKARKILIAGPNYRTVEELSGRLLDNLNKDTASSADYFWVYSRSRSDVKNIPDTEAHLHARSFRLDAGLPAYTELMNSLGDANRTTIISTTAHIVNKLTEAIYGKDTPPIQPIFDLVVLDECSQIPVTLALRPLAVLKPAAQLVVAGDHLQMPPIHSLEPPKDAEYLVGSIQTYFVERFDLQKEELLVNYRSNQDLVDYARTLGYPSALKAYMPTKQLYSLVDLDKVISSMPSNLPKSDAYRELLIPERRVAALIHDDAVSSQANEFEAKIVAGLAYCIRNAMAQELFTGQEGSFTPFTDEQFFLEGLGIVTPHKAQKALVLKELRALFPNASPESIFDAVDTVERFQGGERQTIIISFGVGDTDVIEGEEAFLLQMERTNVAVSRAKAKCIVLMPKSLAYHLPTDQKAAETAFALKSYVEEFCVHRQPIEILYDSGRRFGEVRWH